MIYRKFSKSLWKTAVGGEGGRGGKPSLGDKLKFRKLRFLGCKNFKLHQHVVYQSRFTTPPQPNTQIR